MGSLKRFAHYVVGSLGVISRGPRVYYAWVGFLLVLLASGAASYHDQVTNGLITSNMRDQVSWGFYIGNFAYLVGVAAAAVVLVIPAYVYRWGPIREVVLLGETMSVAAIMMCMLFVTVDVGRPDRLWHLLPGLGLPNFPYSLLVWDILVLTSYFAINLFINTYMLYKGFTGRPYNPSFILPIIFLSIPLAICIHTVTAFLFMGLSARPYWHTAILAPRFIASAFCSGPALMVLVFQILRRVSRLQISDAALFKTGELLAYAMAINLFLLGSEVFSEFYFETAHSIHAQLQWFGTHGMTDMVAYTWGALACNVIAFVIFLVPGLRSSLPLLTLGCALAAGGIYIEKGMGLLLPGMTPDMLGEFYAYRPSLTELRVGAGIWGFGALAFTFMAKVAIAVSVGELRAQRQSRPLTVGPRQQATAASTRGVA